MGSIGAYLHIPFCDGKCPYCDFYSLSSLTPLLLDDYTDALIRSITYWSEATAATADTVYFGGGTPSLLGAHRIERVLSCVRDRFSVSPDAEITMEVNPSRELTDILCAFASHGGNRLSIGMQSAHEDELRLLGRRHTREDVQRAVVSAQKAGIDNISLDVMLGVPASTIDSVCQSVDTAVELGARHVSAYMLKIEPNTPYGRCTPSLPDDDMAADMYLAAMERLDSHGFAQYEISNAAILGYESRHNLKYWLSEPYIGIGPAASSFFNNRRFTYSRDISSFMRGDLPSMDSATAIGVGSEEEYACLRLRLRDGITESEFRNRFGHSIPSEWYDRALTLPRSLVVCDDGIRLTRQGFLVSNLLIGHIFDE